MSIIKRKREAGGRPGAPQDTSCGGGHTQSPNRTNFHHEHHRNTAQIRRGARSKPKTPLKGGRGHTQILQIVIASIIKTKLESGGAAGNKPKTRLMERGPPRPPNRANFHHEHHQTAQIRGQEHAEEPPDAGYTQSPNRTNFHHEHQQNTMQIRMGSRSKPKPPLVRGPPMIPVMMMGAMTRVISMSTQLIFDNVCNP